MNEFDMAQRIIRQLDEGISQLGPEQAGRLYALRQKALAQVPMAQQPLRFDVLASAHVHHPHGRSAFHPRGHQGTAFLRMMGVTLLMALTIYMLGDWSGDSDDDNGQLDAKLLSSEISPQTFAQKDFGAWLQETR